MLQSFSLIASSLVLILISLEICREKGMKRTLESYKRCINKNGGQSGSQTKFDLWHTT